MSERFFQPIGETTKDFLNRQELSIEGIKTEADIENIAWSVLEEDEYAKYLMERIEQARAAGREDEDSIRERASLLNEVKVEIALVSGVEIDALDHSRQKNEYRKKIFEIVHSLDKNSPDEEIMQKLKIVTPVSGRRGFIFNFPTDILPQYIQEQWNVYMGMVDQFETAVSKLQKGVISQTEFSGIDLIRKKAHNTVSQSIGEVLGFSGWELEDYRRFVAKMRDKKYDEKMGEISRYANDFKNEFVPEHLSVISEKIRDFR